MRAGGYFFYPRLFSYPHPYPHARRTISTHDPRPTTVRHTPDVPVKLQERVWKEECVKAIDAFLRKERWLSAQKEKQNLELENIVL